MEEYLENLTGMFDAFSSYERVSWIAFVTSLVRNVSSSDERLSSSSLSWSIDSSSLIIWYSIPSVLCNVFLPVTISGNLSNYSTPYLFHIGDWASFQ